MKKSRLNPLVLAAAVFAPAFLLNLLWEVSHSLLYNWNLPPLVNDVYFFIPRILRAALADAFIIFAIFLLLCIIRKGVAWVCSPQKRDYLIIAALGLAFSLAIEIQAISSHRWSYAAGMPLVFGIGLTPLVQLAVTGSITLFVAGKLAGRKS